MPGVMPTDANCLTVRDDQPAGEVTFAAISGDIVRFCPATLTVTGSAVPVVSATAAPLSDVSERTRAAETAKTQLNLRIWNHPSLSSGSLNTAVADASPVCDVPG